MARLRHSCLLFGKDRIRRFDAAIGEQASLVEHVAAEASLGKCVSSSLKVDLHLSHLNEHQAGLIWLAAAHHHASCYLMLSATGFC